MNEGGVVDLGFARAKVPAGTHVCQVYTDDDERADALLQFVARGLQNDESTACFSDNVTEQVVAAWLARDGVSIEDEKKRGRLTLSRARDVYFEGGSFDPERLVALLVGFHEASLAAGRSHARIMGEMSSEISRIPGGSRLMEYESRVNDVLFDYPVTAVCQYDARVFDGATIMDVLSVHPMMVVRGAVVHNPFFVAPAALRGR